eukprot:CAMPEP_0205921292 /NCGR_PEP_ID=MMETSP1325-20131115/12610_1 /ASSEMBLY_ACC=CAM_ASM_000708 /TAXON_ID=236786 /ORGANISM="Florenciella sp., Strain RCC1007" /LENGTH=168 /DNA_ID=CAMNT_0053289087 /DNA_START=104 /DNA_END=610 /DNA_ORIENTATION=+
MLWRRRVLRRRAGAPGLTKAATSFFSSAPIRSACRPTSSASWSVSSSLSYLAELRRRVLSCGDDPRARLVSLRSIDLRRPLPPPLSTMVDLRCSRIMSFLRSKEVDECFACTWRLAELGLEMLKLTSPTSKSLSEGDSSSSSKALKITLSTPFHMTARPTFATTSSFM